MESEIETKARSTLDQLSPDLRSWAEGHLVTPQKLKVWVDPDGSVEVEVWIVTDAVGIKDSSYRVVYDEKARAFGLECKLSDGRSWYMGPYGTFAEAVENM